jgi:uncharacterized protein YndB with AHSA1/START domain
MTRLINPELDLSMSRIIKAPRQAIWNAWSDPRSLEQWWVPAPAKCRVVDMEFRPGGAFATEISENGGDFAPHMNASFLAIDEGRRIVFTDALLGGWRPAEHPFITAIITLTDHPDGTDYAAHVMHKNKADRNRHEEMGFHDGWGTVVTQLAERVEGHA